MKASKNQILIPMDFSEQALIALGQSKNIARLSKAEITLLYVIYEESFNTISKILSHSKAQSETMEKGIREKLGKLAEETSNSAGIKVNTLVVKGKVYEQIVKVAKRIKAILIIMGTTGSKKGIKKFIGTNTLNVVREAPCPVITIKGKKHRFGCKTIVLPLDLTKETKEKVNKAIEFANLFTSTIRIVSILPDEDEFIVNKLTRQLNQVKIYVENRDISCTAELIKGSSVAKEIVKYAKKVEADIIMIMTQQEKGWLELFIGPYAQQVINNTEIPVLCIRPTEKKDMVVFQPY